MTSRWIALTAATLVVMLADPGGLVAQTPSKATFTEPLAVEREQVRPDPYSLATPPGFTREQILLGDRVFHGEKAGGQCSHCHGWDGKGTPIGNDLTTGMYIWGDGSVTTIKRTVLHNMTMAPGMDGDLKPADVEAVAGWRRYSAVGNWIDSRPDARIVERSEIAPMKLFTLIRLQKTGAG
jgi:hypothetical protein